HMQYFLNPIGALACETLDSLEQMNLGQAALTLHEALSVFPNRIAPKEEVERQKQLAALSAEQKAVLNRCDRAARAMKNSVEVLRYLRTNQRDVLAPEQV